MTLKIEDPMYDMAPRIVVWEMTRACALACHFCRAQAVPRRDRYELTAMEAFQLVDDVAACDRPLLVLTGGDPLVRDDIYKIVEYGTSLNLPMAVAPCVTDRLTHEAVRQLAIAGVAHISLNLDAPDAAAHDAFCGVNGSYQRTIETIADAREYGVNVHIHTTVAQHNRLRLMEFEDVLAPLGISLWNLFFILPIGLAGIDRCLDAKQTEESFHDIHAIASRADFDVTTSAAPHYRRYAMQHETTPPREWPTSPDRQAEGFDGIDEGPGTVFISHHGDVQPSRFLPLPVGNVRHQLLLDVYQHYPVMQRLRRPDTFDGKCGECEFRRICGGSRARAFAATGNPFESDPACSYIPASAFA